MKLYRLLTGKDDARFCHRATTLLNCGWELYGSPSIATGTDGNQVAQALIKTVADATWSEEIKLDDY